jgi:hypothetical protein
MEATFLSIFLSLRPAFCADLQKVVNSFAPVALKRNWAVLTLGPVFAKRWIKNVPI